MLGKSRHPRRVRVNRKEGIGGEEIMLEVHDAVNNFVNPHACVRVYVDEAESRGDVVKDFMKADKNFNLDGIKLVRGEVHDTVFNLT